MSAQCTHAYSALTPTFFFFFFIYLFIYGCVGSSFLCEGFFQLRQVGAAPHRSARASHYRGLSCRGAQAPDAQAQQLWLTGPAAPRHVGSSGTRARTCVPCTGRRILNHCATREAPDTHFLIQISNSYSLLSTYLVADAIKCFSGVLYFRKIQYFYPSHCRSLANHPDK